MDNVILKTALKNNDNMPKKKRFGLEKEELGLIGSYSSFFGLLLIATILSYRSIFYLIIENFIARIPPYFDYMAIIVSVIFFALLFIIIPAIPISSDICENIREKNFRVAIMLIFLVLIYTIALLFQIIHVHNSIAGNLIIQGVV